MPKIKLNSNILWPIIILLVVFGAFYFKPWQQRQQQTISVSAEGKAEAVPTIAKISVTIATTNPDLDQARSQNEQKVSTVVSKLKELGIAEKDIKTQSISAGPSYEVQIYPLRKPTTNQVSATLAITIRDFKKADTVIAILTENGATNFYGPNLTVDDQTLEAAKSRAREDAVEKAKAKAQELAKFSGRKLGKVVNIKEQGDFRLPQPIFAQGGAELAQKMSQIQPGQNEVSINLEVDFSLK